MKDEEIVEVLRSGPKKNAELRAAFFGVEGTSYDPNLDRALRHLRKVGTVKFDSKRGWTLSKTKPCAACGGTGKVPA